MKDKPPNLPSLISFQDFFECGLVYKCMKSNPNMSDNEVARQTRLLVSRVTRLRAFLEFDQSLPPQDRVFQPVIKSSERKTEIHTDSSEEEELDFPVKIGMDYIGRICRINNNGLGIALIDNFPCHISGANLGELVIFRVREITPDFAEADFVRLLQKASAFSLNIDSLQEEQKEQEEEEGQEEEEAEEENVDSTLRCPKCFSPITKDDYEVHDGLCKNCYYRKLKFETRKADRRSGLFGADRASTW